MPVANAHADSHKCFVGPSILAADPLNLGRAIRSVDNADFLHVDIMDDEFAPGMTWGTHTVRQLARAGLPIEVHLMVADPARWAAEMVSAGADRITFHIEATDDPAAVISLIRDSGCQVGLAVSPETSLCRIAHFLLIIDALLVMTVEPGGGGTPMLPSAPERCREARDLLDSVGSTAMFGVDGGVNRDNIALLASCGVRSFVVGSGVFLADDPTIEVDRLRHLARAGAMPLPAV